MRKREFSSAELYSEKSARVGRIKVPANGRKIKAENHLERDCGDSTGSPRKSESR